MLWLGGQIGCLERLSIASFLTAGHPLKLHVYDDQSGVPAGTEVVDAAETVPRALALSLRHKKTGSFSLAADYFRLQLQRQSKGLWVDTDMVCLRPFDMSEDTVFGWQLPNSINNAVLKLPPDSMVLTEMIAAFQPGTSPEWSDRHRRRQMWMKRLLRIKWDATDLPWGTLGPVALTHLARKYGVDRYAAPIPVFYPVPLSHAPDLLSTADTASRFISEETKGVHLWHSALDPVERAQPNRNSFIGQLVLRFGV